MRIRALSITVLLLGLLLLCARPASAVALQTEESYDDNGVLRIRYTYHLDAGNPVQQGTYMSRNAFGDLEEVTEYVDGVKHGSHTWYEYDGEGSYRGARASLW